MPMVSAAVLGVVGLGFMTRLQTPTGRDQLDPQNMWCGTRRKPDGDGPQEIDRPELIGEPVEM
jgi:hypothetical protein